MGILQSAYAAPLAIAIFIVTLILVIWQPRGLGIGFSAIAGAIFALATGVVSWQDIPQVWGIVWNATFTLVALIIISLILDAAGFFRWLAMHLARWGLGRGGLLFSLVVLLGAAVTALLTNDGTVLIWTPTVMEMLLALGFSKEATLAFVIASGFIADATSLPFPVSNLVNIITADYFKISFLRYSLVMVPCTLVAIATSLGVLWFYFGRYIPKTYNISGLQLTSDRIIKDPLVFRYSFVVLGLLLLGYFFAEPLGAPVSFIAGLGALFMLALAGRWFHRKTARVINLKQVLREAPWQVILFSLGMYLVVTGLRNVGLTNGLSDRLQYLSHWGITQVAIGTGFLATLLASVMNNLPAVLINAIAIQDTDVTSPHIREAMIYANAIACDLGAKITPIGSLATLLWMDVLARKGIRISWVQYIRTSIILTLPVLFVTLLSLAIWLPWLIA
ncbi:arsenic transporter [Microcoleus sp. FACHB-831]|uniref:arsenic transporter n=1 Tax=Microcoleus sp. FACHB-831 TaxID=2692827 RepID=UPI00168819A7|nr:arsenic transporter [Microcoleus sp. FACHB-831]MBD1920925.1 arsenic transporter [Microcoleus sp. FACHB-831]